METFKHLENWNNFGFRQITKSDYSKVLTHFQDHFYKDEPTSKLLGTSPEWVADLNKRYSSIMDLSHGSYYAYPLDNPDKVAAVLINWYHKKGEQLHPFEPISPVTAAIRDAIQQLKSHYNIYENHGVDIYPELFIISTDPEYRGKGLASEMYKKSIAKFRSEGHTLVSSRFSHPMSRKIGEKLEFKEVNRLNFSECKKPDGSPLFSEAGIEHFTVETILLL